MTTERPRFEDPAVERLWRIAGEVRGVSNGGEPVWEWPGMFWRWSTGPIRRAYCRARGREITPPVASRPRR